jgi:hypothetical protein
MMVMVRRRDDLDHKVNGQCRDANQGRAQERFHFTSKPGTKLPAHGITKSYGV